MSNVTIGIVEDNQDFSELLSGFLTRKGYNILFRAVNGKSAIELYNNSSNVPDILLLDYRLPLMDGITVARIILKNYPKQKIIFMTADHQVPTLASELEIYHILIKPFDLIELISFLDEAGNPII